MRTRENSESSKKQKTGIRLDFNSPVILGMACISILIVLLN